ncbi:MAG: sodium-dependent transporter, partial [Bacillota bacterium]|nr:sodium-dependent transporter [Bacillota bacterium]
MKERQGFGSSLGMILAAAGSAIGVGNIWRFPYVTGKYGGAAFLIVYLLMIVVIGMPLMLAEIAVGRRGGSDACKSFKTLAPGSKWHISGIIGIVAAFVILGYYSVVAGWSLKYVVSSLGNAFAGQSPDAIASVFRSHVSSNVEPIIYALII